LDFDILKGKGCLKGRNGWYSVDKMPSISERKVYNIGNMYGGDVEIGYRRFQDDIVQQLFNAKKRFRIGWIEKWLDDICSFEFGVSVEDPSNDLAILDALGGNEKACQFGYASPINFILYEKRKVMGDFR